MIFEYLNFYKQEIIKSEWLLDCITKLFFPTGDYLAYLEGIANSEDPIIFMSDYHTSNYKSLDPLTVALELQRKESKTCGMIFAKKLVNSVVLDYYTNYEYYVFAENAVDTLNEFFFSRLRDYKSNKSGSVFTRTMANGYKLSFKKHNQRYNKHVLIYKTPDVLLTDNTGATVFKDERGNNIMNFGIPPICIPLAWYRQAHVSHADGRLDSLRKDSLELLVEQIDDNNFSIANSPVDIYLFQNYVDIAFDMYFEGLILFEKWIESAYQSKNL
ncbi:MAG: hypothetical protein RL660_1859 [Bacteroidota bacterium]|jgi:hypothetical protein